jgi:hypothetical protein
MTGRDQRQRAALESARVMMMEERRLRVFDQAALDLCWLAERGALPGAAEILAERRCQIEAGHTVAEDARKRAYGGLLADAHFHLARLASKRSTPADGSYLVAADEPELRQAGALIAAEIDRKHYKES